MIRFVQEAGPFIWPIFLLAAVIGLLALWNAICLLPEWRGPISRRRQGVDAVLFWGGVAAILGFLGQWIGIHRLSRAVAELGFVGPQEIAYGISESLLTPVAGMVVFIFAAFVWFLLRLGVWWTYEGTRLGALPEGRARGSRAGTVPDRGESAADER